MNRRLFIKTGLIFVPSIVSGQVILRNAKIQNAKLAQAVATGVVGKNFIRVQFKHAYIATAATFTGNTVNGNSIVVAVLSSSVGATGCGDTQGNTYTLIATQAGSGGFLSVFLAISITGGACTVTATGASGDIGLTVVEYSGITSIDTFNQGSGSTPSLALTTTSTDMFFAAYGNETSDGYTSSALNPGSIAGALIQKDTAHIDAQVEWLNSSAGFSAGSWTVDLNGTGIWIAIALK